MIKNYSIFQLTRVKYDENNVTPEFWEYHGNLFAKLSFYKKTHNGQEPNIKNYTEVYNGEVDIDNSVDVTLEKLFEKFNIDHPLDFHGHSLSVSDVICLDGKYYYCDSFGFVNLANFNK